MNAIFAAGPFVLRVSRPSAPGEAALAMHETLRVVRHSRHVSGTAGCRDGRRRWSSRAGSGSSPSTSGRLAHGGRRSSVGCTPSGRTHCRPGIRLATTSRSSVVGFPCAAGGHGRPRSTRRPASASTRRWPGAPGGATIGTAEHCRTRRVPRRRPSGQRGDERRRAGAHGLGPDELGAGRMGPRTADDVDRAVGRCSGGLRGVRGRIRPEFPGGPGRRGRTPSCGCWRRR